MQTFDELSKKCLCYLCACMIFNGKKSKHCSYNAKNSTQAIKWSNWWNYYKLEDGGGQRLTAIRNFHYTCIIYIWHRS